MSADATHVGDFLKEHDRDRYLATLVLSGATRDAVQALFAFGAEVAAVPSRVSEPGPGEIRLQWWRDALEGEGHGNVSGNPVAAALFKTLADYDLSRGPLVRLIAARRFDLYQDPMPDMETFEGYAGETNSVLYQYAAMVLSGGEAAETSDASGHLGVAHALIGHLRALGHNAAHGRIFLPWSRFAAHGVGEQELFAGRDTEGVKRAVSQLTETAATHLDTAREAIGAQPKHIRPAFAILPVLQAQLKALKKRENSLDTPRNAADWQDILRVTLWAMRNS